MIAEVTALGFPGDHWPVQIWCVTRFKVDEQHHTGCHPFFGLASFSENEPFNFRLAGEAFDQALLWWAGILAAVTGISAKNDKTEQSRNTDMHGCGTFLAHENFSE